MKSKKFETKVGTWEVTERDGWIATIFTDNFNLLKFKELFPNAKINPHTFKWNIWESSPQKELEERLKLLL